jgi:hypothetical protein
MFLSGLKYSLAATNPFALNGSTDAQAQVFGVV